MKKLLTILVIMLALQSVGQVPLFKPGQPYIKGIQVKDLWGSVWTAKVNMTVANAAPVAGTYWALVRHGTSIVDSLQARIVVLEGMARTAAGSFNLALEARVNQLENPTSLPKYFHPEEFQFVDGKVITMPFFLSGEHFMYDPAQNVYKLKRPPL